MLGMEINAILPVIGNVTEIFFMRCKAVSSPTWPIPREAQDFTKSRADDTFFLFLDGQA